MNIFRNHQTYLYEVSYLHKNLMNKTDEVKLYIFKEEGWRIYQNFIKVILHRIYESYKLKLLNLRN